MGVVAKSRAFSVKLHVLLVSDFRLPPRVLRTGEMRSLASSATSYFSLAHFASDFWVLSACSSNFET